MSGIGGSPPFRPVLLADAHALDAGWTGREPYQNGQTLGTDRGDLLTVRVEGGVTAVVTAQGRAYVVPSRVSGDRDRMRAWVMRCIDSHAIELGPAAGQAARKPPTPAQIGRGLLDLAQKVPIPGLGLNARQLGQAVGGATRAVRKATAGTSPTSETPTSETQTSRTQTSETQTSRTQTSRTRTLAAQTPAPQKRPAPELHPYSATIAGGEFEAVPVPKASPRDPQMWSVTWQGGRDEGIVGAQLRLSRQFGDRDLGPGSYAKRLVVEHVAKTTKSQQAAEPAAPAPVASSNPVGSSTGPQRAAVVRLDLFDTALGLAAGKPQGAAWLLHKGIDLLAKPFDNPLFWPLGQRPAADPLQARVHDMRAPLAFYELTRAGVPIDGQGRFDWSDDERGGEGFAALVAAAGEAGDASLANVSEVAGRMPALKARYGLSDAFVRGFERARGTMTASKAMDTLATLSSLGELHKGRSGRPAAEHGPHGPLDVVAGAPTKTAVNDPRPVEVRQVLPPKGPPKAEPSVDPGTAGHGLSPLPFEAEFTPKPRRLPPSRPASSPAPALTDDRTIDVTPISTETVAPIRRLRSEEMNRSTGNRLTNPLVRQAVIVPPRTTPHRATKNPTNAAKGPLVPLPGGSVAGKPLTAQTAPSVAVKTTPATSPKRPSPVQAGHIQPDPIQLGHTPPSTAVRPVTQSGQEVFSGTAGAMANPLQPPRKRRSEVVPGVGKTEWNRLPPEEKTRIIQQLTSKPLSPEDETRLRSGKVPLAVARTLVRQGMGPTAVSRTSPLAMSLKSSAPTSPATAATTPGQAAATPESPSASLSPDDRKYLDIILRSPTRAQRYLDGNGLGRQEARIRAGMHPLSSEDKASVMAYLADPNRRDDFLRGRGLGERTTRLRTHVLQIESSGTAAAAPTRASEPTSAGTPSNASERSSTAGRSNPIRNRAVTIDESTRIRMNMFLTSIKVPASRWIEGRDAFLQDASRRLDEFASMLPLSSDLSEEEKHSIRNHVREVLSPRIRQIAQDSVTDDRFAAARKNAVFIPISNGPVDITDTQSGPLSVSGSRTINKILIGDDFASSPQTRSAAIDLNAIGALEGFEVQVREELPQWGDVVLPVFKDGKGILLVPSTKANPAAVPSATQGAVARTLQHVKLLAAAARTGMNAVESRVYLEQGNVIATRKADGAKHVFIGIDSLLISQTALEAQGLFDPDVLRRTAAGLDEADLRRVVEQRRKNLSVAAPTSSADAAALDANVRSLLAKEKLTKVAIAEDLGLKPDQITYLPQAAFHIDLLMRPSADGVVLLDSPQLGIDLLQRRAAAKGSPVDDSTIKRMRDSIATMKEIKQAIEASGFHVIEVSGNYPKPKDRGYVTNFMNGVMGKGKDGKTFYVTNKSRFADMNDEFKRQMDALGIRVYFIEHDMFDQSGGINCVTIEAKRPTPKTENVSAA